MSSFVFLLAKVGVDGFFVRTSQEMPRIYTRKSEEPLILIASAVVNDPEKAIKKLKEDHRNAAYMNGKFTFKNHEMGAASFQLSMREFRTNEIPEPVVLPSITLGEYVGKYGTNKAASKALGMTEMQVSLLLKKDARVIKNQVYVLTGRATK